MRSSSQIVAACAMSDRRLARITSRIVSSNSSSENPAVGRDVGSSDAITVLLEQWYLLVLFSFLQSPTKKRRQLCENGSYINWMCLHQSDDASEGRPISFRDLAIELYIVQAFALGS
jgi:hypothetical protein